MAKQLNKVSSYVPTITQWNRLEGRPRREDFDRAMKAEVRDALWMISKQWQMGEFIGDDAGSPILAKAHMDITSLTKYQAGDASAVAMEQDIPLEVKVEHQKIPFQQGSKEVALDIRLLMGRQWLKWINQIDASLKPEYIETYPIDQPDPTKESDAHICAHVEAWQRVSAAAGRCMDGYQLYHYLKQDTGHHAYNDIDGVNTSEKETDIDTAAGKFIQWYEQLYYQSHDQENSSWKPSYLEHQFACSAPQDSGEKVLIADEYYHGHLDWYNLDIDNERSELGETESPAEDMDVQKSITRTFIPTSVTFGGMPHPRWWQMESWKTNLGFIKPDTTDLNKLLLLDFFLVYSNDWFMVPFTLPVGSLANIRGLMVTNTFGEKNWINAAGSGSDEDWQRWNMYTHNIKGTEDIPADLGVSFLPVSRKVLEGKPLEEIYMLRDEIANMVWGVESRVPLMTGKGKPGREVGQELRKKLQELVDEDNPESPEIEFKANIRYQIVNSVPEEWIPFVPVHKKDSYRETELQRAAMPRILENDPDIPKKIEPRTSLLREGLDQTNPVSYFIHEEEIPRAGAKIHKSFQRTRWYDGKVYNWVGIRKKTGRGEGHSGLAFDQIVPVKQDESSIGEE